MKALDSKNEYSIAWIAALPIERAAATALLDEEHEEPLDFEQNESDPNSYTWGLTSDHNVVIASLPAGRYGLTSATAIVSGLLASHSHIRIGLLVGIGAAFPECGLDIRLGDVAVSLPGGTSSGVVQYDTGKAKAESWERTGALAPPPPALLHAVSKLQTIHELDQPRITMILEDAAAKNPGFRKNFSQPQRPDRLFHEDGNELQRQSRMSDDPQIHYGTIASGNVLVKASTTRRDIYDSIGLPCICLEMEAAGLMNAFPCLVVRGICDYADAHKNDDWQRYASATAAAYTKELLSHLPKRAVEKTKKLEEVLKALQSTLTRMFEWEARDKEAAYRKRVSKMSQAFYIHAHSERKDRNPQRIPGTCEWFTSHRLFRKWMHDPEANILWVSADPGCGKSVLARHLIEDILPADDGEIVYFFFKDDFQDQRDASTACSIMVHQLLSKWSHVIPEAVLSEFEARGAQITASFMDTWALLMQIMQLISRRILVVIDALDECEKTTRSKFVELICTAAHGGIFQLLVLSRPYFDIREDFQRREAEISILHLAGDNDKERDQISHEIDLVIEYRVAQFSQRRQLLPGEQDFLLARFRSVPHRTYLWAHLVLAIVESTPGFTTGNVKHICAELPQDVNVAYNKILQRSVDPGKTKLILQFLLAAERPLSIEEMSILLSLTGSETSYEEFDGSIEPPERFRHTLRDLCGLFVIIVDEHVYLLHQTAREFLTQSRSEQSTILKHTPTSSIFEYDWNGSIAIEAANRVLAQRCLWFIQVSAYSESYFADYHDATLWDGILELPVLTAPQLFFEYCAKSWVKHAIAANLQQSDHILQVAACICDASFPCLTSWGSLFHWHHGRQDDDVLARLGFGTAEFGLLFPASLGLPSLLLYVLNRNLHYSWEMRTKALQQAVLWNFSSTVLALLEAGAGANSMVKEPWDLREYPAVADSYGKHHVTLLFIAIRWQNLEMAKALVQHGAKIDEPSTETVRTPLHEAACRCWLEAMEVLIEHGANSGVYDYKNQTPLNLFLSNSNHLLPMARNQGIDLLSRKYPRHSHKRHELDRAIARNCMGCVDDLLRRQEIGILEDQKYLQP